MAREASGTRHGQIDTIHDPTNIGVVVDAPHRNRRRTHSAMLSLAPTATGIAAAMPLACRAFTPAPPEAHGASA